MKLETVETTIPAGESRLYMSGGGYFRVYEADGPLSVTFYDSDNNEIASGTFDAGEWLRQDYAVAKVVNGNASDVAVKLRLSVADSGADRIAGTVSVSNPAGEGLEVFEHYDSQIRRYDTAAVFAVAARKGMFIRPPGAGGVLLERLTFSSEFAFEVGFSATTPAAVDAEGVWGSNPFERLSIGDNTSILINTTGVVAAATSAITDAAVASMAMTYPAGTYTFEIPAPFRVYTGDAVGMVISLLNNSGAAGRMAVGLWGRELA